MSTGYWTHELQVRLSSSLRSSLLEIRLGVRLVPRSRMPFQSLVDLRSDGSEKESDEEISEERIKCLFSSLPWHHFIGPIA